MIFIFFFFLKSNFKIHKTQVINKTLYKSFYNKKQILNMSIIKKINKIIDSSIGDFCQQIATKYDLSKDELIEMWHQSNSVNKKKGTKKRSPYQNYAAYLRPLLIEKNPDITFGEISGETSRRWKEFTPEQKAQYKSTEARENEIPVPNVAVLVEPKEKKVPKESKSRPVKKANNSLECKKLPELKEMCKEHGLTTTGKKQDLIDRLKNVNREEHLSPVVALSDAEDSDNDSHNDNDNDNDNDSDNDNAVMDDQQELVNGISPISMNGLVSLQEMDDESDETQEPEEKPAQVNYSEMTLAQIKELCKERGVSSKGNKTELIHRLTA